MCARCAACAAHAELTLLHLERLIDARTDEKERELEKSVRKAHESALELNPKLAMHTLKTGGFAEALATEGNLNDVLANAVQQRHRLIAERNGRGQPKTPEEARAASRDALDRASTLTADERAGLLVPLPSCERSRARLDVLRLQGADAAAETLEDKLLADLAGRKLPPAVYEEEPEAASVSV